MTPLLTTAEQNKIWLLYTVGVKLYILCSLMLIYPDNFLAEDYYQGCNLKRDTNPGQELFNSMTMC